MMRTTRELFVEPHRRRDGVRAELHGCGSERIRRLERMPRWPRPHRPT
jgi:hypothetical protein